MTKPPRLDAPRADLRPLDRGTLTKAVGVEPRVGPTMAQERETLLAKLDKDKAARLAKIDQGPTHDTLAEVHGNGNVTCSTATRPSKGLRAGMMIFDLDLNRPLWRNTKNPAWITAAGVPA